MINDLRELEQELAGWAGGSKDAPAMDADLQASTATPVDAMGPIDEGATPDDTDDLLPIITRDTGNCAMGRARQVIDHRAVSPC